jgi:SAM-dependent methyltransferase
MLEPKFRFPLNEPINIHITSFIGRLLAAPLALCSWATYLIPDMASESIVVRMNERIVELPLIYSLAAPQQGKRVLDFGCNESKFALELASLGCEVTGVDLERYRLEHPNLSFLQGDFLDAELPANSFDLVTAISALEHTGLSYYSGDKGERADQLVVNKFFELLKPEGELIVSVPVGVEEEFPPYYRSYGRAVYELFSQFELLNSYFFSGKDRDATRENACYWSPCTEDEAFQQKNKLQGLSAVGVFHLKKGS